MALTKEILGTNNIFSPYVHSSIQHFQDNFKYTIASPSNDDGLKRIERTKEKLKRIAEELKTEAEIFLNGKTAKQLTNELLNVENTYTQIATRILTTRQMRNMLMGGKTTYKIEDIQNILGYSIPNKILDIMDKEGVIEITEDRLVDAIIEWLQDNGANFFDLSFQKQKTKLKRPFKNEQIKVMIEKEMKKRLRSSKGRIKDIVTKAIQQANLKNNNNNTKHFDLAFEYFEKQFMSNLGNIHYNEKTQKPEDFLKRMREELKKRYVNTTDKSNVTGDLSEVWETSIIISDNENGFNIEMLGKLSENEIEDSNNPILANLQKMKTHHDTSKFSQTDLVIVNPQGKKVRVQSKNTIEVLEKIRSGKKIPQIFSVQGKQEYVNLINQLRSTGVSHLSDDDIKALSYLLANEIWFRTKGSYLKKKRGNKTKTVQRRHKVKNDGLNETVHAINTYLMQELTNFLGITIEDNIKPENIKVYGSASNILFFFANQVFVPTYEIIESLIKQLEDFTQTLLFRFQVTLNVNSVNTAGYTAASLYREKVKKAGPLDWSRHYTDPELIDVGAEVGEAIINSLTINRVNIYGDLTTLLYSAYGGFI